MSGKRQASISLIILHYNRPENLLNLIRSVPLGVEVVVADDGSPSLPELPPGVRQYRRLPKTGVSAASCRNGGAALATTDYLVFLDDDVEPHPFLFRAHWLALQMYDVSLGLLTQEKLKPYTDPRASIYVDMERRAWRFCLSGNLAITRAAFDAVGGFDIAYDGGHGWEDLDLGIRLQNAGKRFVMNWLAVAYHPGEHMAWKKPEAVQENYRKFVEKWGEVV